MPHEYQTEAKTKFPLPEYPQEDQCDNPIQYKTAVMQFRVDHTRVLVQCNEWVDHEQISDIACTSKAACLQAEADRQ